MALHVVPPTPLPRHAPVVDVAVFPVAAAVADPDFDHLSYREGASGTNYTVATPKQHLRFPSKTYFYMSSSRPGPNYNPHPPEVYSCFFSIVV